MVLNPLIESRPCPCCGSEDKGSLTWALQDEHRAKPRTSHIRPEIIPNLELSFCRACKLIYWSVYAKDLEDKLYRSEYRKDGFCNSKHRQIENHIKSVLFQKNINPFIKKDGLILDVGCAEGYFVKYLIDNGYKAEGLEINDKSVEFGRSQGLTIYDKHITELKQQKYQFVFTSGYFEHLHNPREVLIHMRDHILLDGGYLYVGTPDANTPSFDHLSEFFPPEHLQTFTVSTLTNLLTSCGFDVVWTKKDNYNKGLAIVAKKTDRLEGRPDFLFDDMDSMLSRLKLGPITFPIKDDWEKKTNHEKLSKIISLLSSSDIDVVLRVFYQLKEAINGKNSKL